MKVALCLTGQLRTAKRCFPSIKRTIIDPYNPTVFFCTEDEKIYHSSLGQGTNDADLSEIVELYKPIIVRKLHSLEKSTFIQPKVASLANIVNSTNTDRFINDLYKKKMAANDLIWLNENFDVVIRSRFDLQIEDVLPLEIVNGITVPEGQDWLSGLNDQLAWGDIGNMVWYMSLFDFVVDYNKSGVPVHPETMLRHHLNVRNISIFRTSLNYSIAR